MAAIRNERGTRHFTSVCLFGLVAHGRSHARGSARGQGQECQRTPTYKLVPSLLRGVYEAVLDVSIEVRAVVAVRSCSLTSERMADGSAGGSGHEPRSNFIRCGPWIQSRNATRV